MKLIIGAIFRGNKIMETKKELKSPKKNRKKMLLIITAILAAVFLLILLIIPAYLSSEKGRQKILSKINDSVDGQANFASLSMSWFKGIKITDISFTDNAGTTSVAVKEITAKPQYASILTGSLSLGETVIDQPDIEINLTEKSPKTSAPPRLKTSASEKPQPIVLPVRKINLVVNQGRLKVTDPDAGTTELTSINSKINLNPPGQKSDFDMAAILLAQGKQSTIAAAGQATQSKKDPWTLKSTTGDFNIEVNDLSLESLATVLAIAGVDIQAKGNLSANLKTGIKDGKLSELSGTIKARDLDITAEPLKGDRLKTSVLELDAKIKADDQLLNIDSLTIKTDWAKVNVAGAAPATYESLKQFLKPDSPYQLKADFDIDLAALALQMPKTLGLKEDAKLTSGKISGNIETLTQQGRKIIIADAALENLSGTVKGKSAALTQPIKAAAKISSDKTGIKFDNVNVSASFATINCSGSAESLDYNARLDIGKLQSELGQFLDTGKYQLTGNITDAGNVTSKDDVFNIAGQASAENIKITSPEAVTASEPKTQVKYVLAADTKKNLIDLKSLHAEASFGQITIKDSIIPLSEKAESPLKVNVSANLDLQKLQPFAVLFARLPKQAQISGTARADISVTQKNSIYNIYTDSTRLENLKITYPQKEPFEQKEVSLLFDADINPAEKTINLKKLKLESPQIKIPEAQFEQTKLNGLNRLKGRAKLQYDWSAISTIAAPYMPQGLTLSGKRNDFVAFDTSYPADKPEQLMANLSTTAKIGFDSAQYMGLDFGSTELNLRVQKGLLNIEPFSTTVNNGKFNFAALADFNKKPTLLTLPRKTQIIENINIDERTTNQLLKYVNPVFANALNVSGIANFQCETLAIPLTGSNKSALEVIGTLAIDNINMQASDLLGKIISAIGNGSSGQTLTIHPTRFVLKDNFLRYDNMQMDIGNNPINFKGVIGLDNSLDMIITLPYTTAGRTARTGSESSGQRISVPLRGTIDRPQLDLAGLLEGQIKQQLEQQLRRGLEKWLKRD